jgi:hypothetical protein
MVDNILPSIVSSPAYYIAAKPVCEPAKSESAKPIAKVLSETPTISMLSRQLADSAIRAENRDNNLSHKPLGELGRKLNQQIMGEHYHANKIKHDSEVPDTSDPELLARAKSATDFVNLASKWDQTAKNPFAGLSYNELTLIAYDDSGTYTVNERRAASYGADAINQAWAKKVSDMAMEEYSRTGVAQSPKVLAEMLSHYRTLPRIEQAQYPEGYEAGLQSKLGPDALTTNN